MIAIFKRWRNARLERRVAELEADLDATRRKLAVAEVEIESMAAVIARDRARIKAEAAAYARQQAEAEGMTDEQRAEDSPRRLRA